MTQDGQAGESRARSTVGMHVWLVLWRAARALEAHARRSIRTLGMCQSDFGVLEALLHRGPQTVSELRFRVLLTSGSMTAAIDRLERHRFVERRSDRVDRRAKVVHLTAQGRTIIRKAFAEHEEAMSRATATLSRHEHTVAITLLRKLGLGAQESLKNRQG
jgi:MarR family 2-MHQ and catechol resistance regulon transcriptional repressor